MSTEMKRLMKLFESDSPDKLTESDDSTSWRIALEETVTVYYGFSGTTEEAEALIARINAGEIDIEEEPMAYFEYDNDESRQRTNARLLK